MSVTSPHAHQILSLSITKMKESQPIFLHLMAKEVSFSSELSCKASIIDQNVEH